MNPTHKLSKQLVIAQFHSKFSTNHMLEQKKFPIFITSAFLALVGESQISSAQASMGKPPFQIVLSFPSKAMICYG